MGFLSTTACLIPQRRGGGCRCWDNRVFVVVLYQFLIRINLKIPSGQEYNFVLCARVLGKGNLILGMLEVGFLRSTNNLEFSFAINV